nr:vegetative cell wall protein gp1-like [Aegilops tauschii subsp. strangulata]
MRARLHSWPLLLALLPPCYCGSAEHSTMPALQLALGHTRVLIVPAARVRLLPQPSQLQPLMHPGFLSLRAPVLARRPRARGLWLSLAAQPRYAVCLRHAAYSVPEAPISAKPAPLARRPPPAPAGSSSRTGSRACRVVLARRLLRPPARPRVPVAPPSTTSGVAPGRPTSTPVDLRVQRPAAPSVRPHRPGPAAAPRRHRPASNPASGPPPRILLPADPRPRACAGPPVACACLRPRLPSSRPPQAGSGSPPRPQSARASASLATSWLPASQHYADSASASCARPGLAPAPPAGSRPRRRPRLAASSLGRPATARPLAGSPLPAGVRLRTRPPPRAGSAYSPPRASGSSQQAPPRPALHSIPAAGLLAPPAAAVPPPPLPAFPRHRICLALLRAPTPELGLPSPAPLGLASDLFTPAPPRRVLRAGSPAPAPASRNPAG